MRKAIMLFLPLGLWAAWAQAPQAPAAPSAPKKEAKEPFKGLAPVSKDVLRVKFPRAQEFKLENGITVLVLEDHRLPQISVSMDIRGGGGLLDPPEQKGLASLSAQMMSEGAGSMTQKQIAEKIDLLGAGIGASAGNTTMSSSFSMSGLSDNFDQWFALGAEIFLHPTYPAEEWAKLKQRTLVNLKQQRTSASTLANERFNQSVFGAHPMALSMTAATVETLNPELMKKWHDERLAPQNTMIGVVGDVSPADAVAKIKAAFGGWKKTEYKPVQPASAAPVAELQVSLVDRPGSVQSNLLLGNVGIDRRSPDYPAFVVMNQILGAGSTARLFNNLREDKGYTYGAYSDFSAGMLPGAWSANSEVRTDVTEGAMHEFFNELKRIREEKAPSTELEEKKRLVVAGFARSMESPASLLSLAMTRKDYGFPEDYWDTYPAKISAVTADDVQRVAQKYLTLNNIQIVAVGDATKVKPVLEQYGKVAIYNTDGKRMQ